MKIVAHVFYIRYVLSDYSVESKEDDEFALAEPTTPTRITYFNDNRSNSPSTPNESTATPHHIYIHPHSRTRDNFTDAESLSQSQFGSESESSWNANGRDDNSSTSSSATTRSNVGNPRGENRTPPPPSSPIHLSQSLRLSHVSSNGRPSSAPPSLRVDEYVFNLLF